MTRAATKPEASTDSRRRVQRRVMPLSPEARKIIIRLLVELRASNTAVTYEVGLAIAQGVFGCMPGDLPDYKNAEPPFDGEVILKRHNAAVERRPDNGGKET